MVDTAYGYQLKQANDIIRKDLKDFTQIVADKAREHKNTVMMGRTHGVHAEPTTFGAKLARWYSEMKRNIERFDRALLKVLKQARSVVRSEHMLISILLLKNTSVKN